MKKTRLLLVDDHPEIADGLLTMIGDSKEFSLTETVRSSSKALEILKKKKGQIDIALIDYSLKGSEINGITLTKIIVKRFPQIKVLAFSGYDEHSIITAMLRAGALGFLLKDGNRKETLRAIKKVAKGEMYFPMLNEKKRNKDADCSFKSILSKREKEIAKLILEGDTSEMIAKKLFISKSTVDTHRKNIIHKLGIRHSAALPGYMKDHPLL